MVSLLYVLDCPSFLPEAQFFPFSFGKAQVFNPLVFEYQTSSFSALSGRIIPASLRWLWLL